MPKPSPQKLSRREREIMDVLFAAEGPVSAEQVREQLTDPPSYSAVRAMLAKLEVKGHIRHREEGLRYVYLPTVSRTAAQQSALERLVNVFFSGSPSHTTTALLAHQEWSDEELDALTAQIAKVRKQRKSK